MATKVSRGGIEYDVPEGEEDFVQKLQDWADREKAEEGLLDVKVLPPAAGRPSDYVEQCL